MTRNSALSRAGAQAGQWAWPVPEGAWDLPGLAEAAGGLEQKISRQVRLDHVVEASECHVKDIVLKTTASLQGC